MLSLFTQAAINPGRLALAYWALELGLAPVEVGLVAASFAVVPIFTALPLGTLAGSLRYVGLLPGIGGALLIAAAGHRCRRARRRGAAGLQRVLGVGGITTHFGAQARITRTTEKGRFESAFGLPSAYMAVDLAAAPVLAGALQGLPNSPLRRSGCSFSAHSWSPSHALLPCPNDD